MHKLTDLLSKTIINKSTIESLGNINGFAVANNLITHIKSTLNYYIPTSRIIANSDVVIVENFKEDTIFNGLIDITPINANLILDNGKIVGSILDYEYNSSFKIVNILLNNSVFKANKTIFFSKDFALVSSKKSSKIEPIIQNDIQTPIFNTPTAIHNYRFLIGRVVNRNILTKSKSMLIKQNTLITDETIDVAKRYGKLVELTLYSN